MKVNELGEILSGIARIHGTATRDVEIDNLTYTDAKTLMIVTSTSDLEVTTTVNIFNKNNKEDK